MPKQPLLSGRSKQLAATRPIQYEIELRPVSRRKSPPLHALKISMETVLATSSDSRAKVKMWKLSLEFELAVAFLKGHRDDRMK